MSGNQPKESVEKYRYVFKAENRRYEMTLRVRGKLVSVPILEEVIRIQIPGKLYHRRTVEGKVIDTIEKQSSPALENYSAKNREPSARDEELEKSVIEALSGEKTEENPTYIPESEVQEQDRQYANLNTEQELNLQGLSQEAKRQESAVSLDILDNVPEYHPEQEEKGVKGNGFIISSPTRPIPAGITQGETFLMGRDVEQVRDIPLETMSVRGEKETSDGVVALGPDGRMIY